MTKRIALKDRTLENDIKYKAPLSYRYIRMIAWFCLIIAQIGMVVRFNIRLDSSSEDQIGWIKNIAEFVSVFPLPLFLLANFAAIFQKKENWKSLLLFYGGVALLLYIVGNVVIIHYGYGLINAFGHIPFMDMAKAFGVILFSLGSSGLVFNIFIDLFLCSLLFFFMNYTPKKLKGKKVAYFRALIALPILYELTSILIKYFVAAGEIQIPFFCFFLLTSKPPLMFVAFLALVVVLKLEEIRLSKTDKGPEFLKEHRKTNAHSLRFSITIAIVFLIAGIIDLIIYVTTSVIIAAQFAGDDPEAVQVGTLYAIYIVEQMGFGKALVLIFVSPLTLLFSYTKTHTNKKIDTFLPVIAIALIAFVFIEGFFQVIIHNVARMVERIKEILSTISG